MTFNAWLFTFLFCFVAFTFLCPQNALSQPEVEIEYSDSPLPLDHNFKITISISNDKLKSISNFPEIENFIKGKTFFIKGKKAYIVEQEYWPLKEGVYTLPPFNLSINGKKFSFKEKTVQVHKSKSKTFAKTIIREPDSKNDANFKPDAFFAVKADKEKVYTGEGFEVSAVFYIAKENNTEFNFIDLKDQVRKIVAHIKPERCLIEEKSLLGEMRLDSAVVNNKTYITYTIYTATFFPLDTTSIKLPSVSFKIITYKIARSPLLIEREAYYQTLNSSPFIVKIQALPPHAYKDKVAVGKYNFEERLSSTRIKEGEMFKYYFTIKNKEGFSSITPPSIYDNKIFEVFAPRVSFKKNLENDQYIYAKTFEFSVVPRSAGKFLLKDHFYWIYFNSGTALYDTLQPKILVQVLKNVEEPELQVSIHQGLYDQMISSASNKIKSKEKNDRIKLISNILILFMLISTFILILKK